MGRKKRMDDPGDLPLETVEVYGDAPPPVASATPLKPHVTQVARDDGKWPKVVKQNERAPKGLTRFRVRVKLTGETLPPRYIIAHAEDDAKAEYRRVNNLPDDADLVVVKLPD